MMKERRFPRGFSVFDPVGTSASASTAVQAPSHDPLELFIAEMMASMAEYAEYDHARDPSTEQQMRAAA